MQALRILTAALICIAACGEGGSDALDARAGGEGEVVCGDPTPGAYCGGDTVSGGDPGTLYQCAGAGTAPTAAMACDAGCTVEPPGTPDRCASDSAYRLPWPAAATMRLTQDCDDSCCSDHVGTDKYAYDWANGSAFTVAAARAGTITHLKINSTSGCGDRSCIGQANFVVVDHGDGTQATYFHLAGGSLAPGIRCGATVTRGQLIAQAGTSGWSTGVHLHFQVSPVHPGAPTCECGDAGTACSPDTVPYSSFWVSAAYPSRSVVFDEWPSAAQCADRRITMPASQN